MFVDFNSAIESVSRFYANKIPFFVAFDYEMQNAVFLGGDDIFSQNGVKFRVGKFTNARNVNAQKSAAQIEVLKTDAAGYAAKFERLKRSILNGDSFLANLTARTPIRTDISLEDIFYVSDSEYALFVEGQFVCFSPECFVKTIGHYIYAYPMKGTIDAAIPDALATLEGDQKEFREHNTIVDLIRNDLSGIARGVRVCKFRFPTRVPRLGKSPIIQTSSEIRGRIKPEIPFGEVLKRMLPAGSISGAPKPKTLEILRDCEGEPRGFYTGIFGYFDGENFDSAVAIRFIENRRGKTFYRSGGGITALSNADAEYAELLEKIYIPLRAKPRFVETLKVVDSRVQDMQRHYARYLKTLAAFYPHATPEPFTAAEFLAKNAPRGVFKLRIEYSDRIEKTELAAYAPKRINTLKTVSGDGVDYSAKFADRSALERLRAMRGGCDDVVICKNGLVCDSSYANLVFAKGGEYFTPKTFLLDGTKRRKLLESGVVRETEIMACDIKKYDRVIFVNAMLDLSDNVGADTSNIF